MRTHSLACRLTALVMSLLLAFSFGAVAAAEGSFTAGTYTGTAKGFGGDVTVTVEVSDSAIVSVEAVGESETDGIGTNALEMLPAAIVSAQSLKVDTVAGCTVTSEAVLAAAEDALRQSGASDEIIFAEPLASETAAEDEVIETNVLIVGAGAAGSVRCAVLTQQRGRGRTGDRKNACCWRRHLHGRRRHARLPGRRGPRRDREKHRGTFP